MAGIACFRILLSRLKRRLLAAPKRSLPRLYLLLFQFQFRGATYGTQQTSNPKVGATTSHEGRKWRRFGADGDEETSTLQCQLIEVLEKNGKILCAQLKAQNTNFQLDREQRKDHTGSLVTVLNKLADALGRIADKL
ncbi:unnamed protein product [Camellia sinensis]